jgi:tetratricopeptide (TPR) repeat protein
MITRVAFVSALGVLLTAGAVHAEGCPDQVPEDAVARRAEAKKWFSQGQTATDAGDDVTAIKAYQCSLKFVPHGFTAYNLAQVAERVGDLDAAIRSYDEYLLLVPDAKDAQEVKERVVALRRRLAKARQATEDLTEIKPPPASSSPALTVQPPAQAQPAPQSLASAPQAEPVAAQSSSSNHYRTAAWIVYGGAGAALVGGLVTNLLARSKMDTCRSTYPNGGQAAAEPVCNDAKTMAYLSYGLFGVGAAAAVVGTVLILHPTESSDVALQVLPQGGLTVGWSGTY